MSDEKNVTMTAREFVMAQRTAHAKARCGSLFAARVEGGVRSFSACHAGFLQPENPCDLCVEHSTMRYPLPKVKRPRVVGMNLFRWRVVDGVLQVREDWQGEGNWHRSDLSPEVIRIVADLLENPDELVEAE